MTIWLVREMSACCAVNKVPTGRVPMRKLNAFIGACVMKEMLDLLPQERTIYVPARSEALAHNNDCPIEAPIVSNVLPETLETFSETGLVDLRDLMDACCESDAERACLRLREEGYTFQEISDRLGLSLAKVFRMFGKLKARILAEWTRGRFVFFSIWTTPATRWRCTFCVASVVRLIPPTTGTPGAVQLRDQFGSQLLVR